MSIPDQKAAGPSLEEAFATLKQLADVFLHGAAHEPASDRPATVLVDEAGLVQAFDSGTRAHLRVPRRRGAPP